MAIALCVVMPIIAVVDKYKVNLQLTPMKITAADRVGKTKVII